MALLYVCFKLKPKFIVMGKEMYVLINNGTFKKSLFLRNLFIFQGNLLLILIRRTKELVNNALILYFSVHVMSIHCFSFCDITSLVT